MNDIGVFSTHAIASGSVLFNQNDFEVLSRKTQDVPQLFQKYVVHLNDEECLAPERFDRLEVRWFINHSDTPNIARKVECVDGHEIRKVYAIQEISPGDEIVIDYNSFEEPEHLKEEYYFK